MPDTGVTVNVNDKSYTQGANALGGDFGTENLTQAQIDARAKLSKFVDSMSDLETLVGAEHIGPEQPYVDHRLASPRDRHRSAADGRARADRRAVAGHVAAARIGR